MVVLKASDMAIESFGLRADEAFKCFLRWILLFLSLAIVSFVLKLESTMVLW
jgi:accessory gene regulator protein AgrB